MQVLFHEIDHPVFILFANHLLANLQRYRFFKVTIQTRVLDVQFRACTRLVLVFHLDASLVIIVNVVMVLLVLIGGRHQGQRGWVQV